MSKWLTNPHNRQWIYTILIAAGAVLAGYGIATAEQIALWTNLAASVLMIGSGALARANTPIDRTNRNEHQ